MKRRRNPTQAKGKERDQSSDQCSSDLRFTINTTVERTITLPSSLPLPQHSPHRQSMKSHVCNATSANVLSIDFECTSSQHKKASRVQNIDETREDVPPSFFPPVRDSVRQSWTLPICPISSALIPRWSTFFPGATSTVAVPLTACQGDTKPRTGL